MDTQAVMAGDIEILQKVELFLDLDKEQLEEIAELCVKVSKSKGDVIMEEGEEAFGFYILLNGEVTISRKMKLLRSSALEKEDRVITKMNADGYPALGETALIGQKYRNTTVRATSDCTLYRIESKLLLAVLLCDYAIGALVFRRVSEMLYKRLAGSSNDVVKLTAALLYALEE